MCPYQPGVGYNALGRKDRERKDTPQPQSDLDKGNGKSHSDRSQVIGGELLIGQLAPWVTWGI